MDLEQEQQKNLIDTTDCLEAVSVFRGWKNFLFIVVILCLLLLQASFWLVNTGYVVTEKESSDKASASVAAGASEQTAETAKEDIKKAAEQVAVTLNQPAEASPKQPQSKLADFHFNPEFKHLAWLIRFVNFVLVFAAMLYCLTMLFSLKVSLLGRLGGINHISRAFFLSLVFVVLLLPWQIPWHKFFAGGLFGAMYTRSELLSAFAALKDSGVSYKVYYYFRFCGFWLIALLLLIFSYIRSCRWAKTILRRLEIV
jgi:hypothetical protein